MNKAALVLILIAALAGCGNPPIVKISPDTYLIVRTSGAGVFANLAAMKVRVIQETNEFAANHGKVAIPISATVTGGYPGRLPTFEYQFRLVDPDSPEAVPTSLEPQADIVIDVDQTIRTND